MIDEKCPTCPKYGTGEYCDCGRSKKSLTSTLFLILGVVGIGYFIYKAFIL